MRFGRKSLQVFDALSLLLFLSCSGLCRRNSVLDLWLRDDETLIHEYFRFVEDAGKRELTVILHKILLGLTAKACGLQKVDLLRKECQLFLYAVLFGLHGKNEIYDLIPGQLIQILSGVLQCSFLPVSMVPLYRKALINATFAYFHEGNGSSE